MKPELETHAYRFSQALLNLIIGALFCTAAMYLPVASAMAGQNMEKERYSASKIAAMLEAGTIKLSASDQFLRGEENGIAVSKIGNYAVFNIQGLDTTDYITLISKGGKFFYAHYGSCSESKTFFNDRTKYLRYILHTRQP